MSYFIITNSLNKKILGTYYQASDAQHNCDVWNEPKFIEHAKLEKITFEPIISNAIIAPKAKLTDLINISSMGFSKRLLMSGKFKKVLEENTKSGVQFFRAPIIYKNEIIEDYWIINVFPPKTDRLDFNKSQIISRRKKEGGGTYVVEEQVSSYAEFIETAEYLWKNKIGQLMIRTIAFKDDANDNLMVIDNTEGGVKHVVSEKLKIEIEDAGISGIEFQPVEVSHHEWLAPGGPREQIYGKA